MGQIVLPFTVHRPKTGDISPVVFDTPHSGIILPNHFRYACSKSDLMHLHDPHVEKLLTKVPDAGVPVLEARIHRTCIDLNRHDDEIDTAMITGQWDRPHRATDYVGSNLGLFPVYAGPRKNRISPIYNDAAKLTSGEAAYRIDNYHTPYYAMLHYMMLRAKKAHGLAFHVNVHSYLRSNKDNSADIIIGNLNNTSCSDYLTAYVENFFCKRAYTTDFNGPCFSGAGLIESMANRAEQHHSMQIEIARDLYMDHDTLELDKKKAAAIRQTMFDLASELYIQTAMRKSVSSPSPKT